MIIVDKIKRMFTKKHESNFLVDYTLWVGEPMDSYRQYNKCIYVPKCIVNEKSYRKTKKAVEEYIISHTKGDVTIHDLYNNEYIQSIFDVSDNLNNLCPLSKSHKSLVKTIKPK